ncbi:ABC transporter permease [Azorhizobium sp. AG788]|uniref:ABC transporter permease n=1 Tax=Azorhizobium sp. AG788 TaxID=2183897 RepID=UPI003138CE63
MPASEISVTVSAPTERSRPRKFPYWLKVRLTQVALIGGFFLFWELGARRAWIDPFFFPAPSAILQRVGEWFSSGDIWNDLGVTLLETVLSFVLGVAGGTALGVWLGLSRFASDVVQPIIKVFNAIPRVLLAPIFVIWFGLGLASKVALGLAIVIFIAFFNTYQGVREVNPVVLANARLLKASRWALLRHVYLPSATSWILSSLRVSVGMAVMGAVVAEYLGSSAGLGHLIAQAEGVMDAVGVFAGILVLSIFVVVLDAAVDRLEKRLLVWRPQTTHDD